MRLSLKLFCILVFPVIVCASDSSTHGRQEWMTHWGESTSPDSRPFVFARGDGLLIDDQDNEYVIGDFINKVDFDPGPGFTEAEAVYNDIFLSKFDPNGNFQWVRTWGLSDPNTRSQIDDNRFPRVALDHQGNFLITGRFFGTWDFDPGPGLETRSSTDWSSVYLLKLDSDGNFLDLKTWDNTSGVYGFKLYVDKEGSVYLVGDFKGRLDLDPGPGELIVDSSSESPGLFLAKYSADLDPQWARTWENMYVWSLVTDADHTLIMSCGFQHQVDADPGPQTLVFAPMGYGDVLVIKLDQAGNLEWAKSWSTPEWMTGFLDLDSAGDIYIAGSFSGAFDFDPGPGEEVKNRIGDSRYAYLSKLDPEGNFQWVRIWGSLRSDIAVNHVLVSNAGIVFVAGSFDHSVDFDPSSLVDSIESNGGFDAFLTVFTPDGEFLWARAIGTDERWEPVRAMALDAHGNVVVTGHGGGDAFLGKFSP